MGPDLDFFGQNHFGICLFEPISLLVRLAVRRQYRIRYHRQPCLGGGIGESSQLKTLFAQVIQGCVGTINHRIAYNNTP